jgi:hypothetical protein
MQVAESDTHAVIGGGKAQAFQLSDSAEFFTILSNTLYRDKQRAVVREVICNAWDAHIVSGKTDVPVEVMLSDNEMIIRDFGPGIADDRIVPIYCVFGGTTKVKDETQNGGFGLGSKAPFAYSDHFSVTSCHNGFKTVYAISRGGIETEGRPDIRAMVKVPTEDTGITVTIPIKEQNDVTKLREHIWRVAKEGGMLVSLNGDLLHRYNYSKARKLGFAVVGDLNLHESHVYVLYGTVLYPLTTVDQALSDKVKKIANIGAPGIHILIAKPSTIGVTPSREALSYTEKTTAALHEMLDKVIRFYSHGIPCKVAQIAREAVDKQERLQINPFCHIRDGGDRTRLLGEANEILNRAATRALDQYHSTQPWRTVYARAALRALASKFKDSRRVFRRAAAKPDNFKPKIEAFHHSSRLTLRLAGRVSQLGALRFMNIGVLTPRFVKPQKFNAYPVISTVLIAANQRDAEAWTKTQKSGQSVAVLVLPKPSEELVTRIKTLAKGYKLEVAIAESTKPVPRPKVVETAKFYSLGDQKYIATLAGERRLEKAENYLRIFGTSAMRYPLLNHCIDQLIKAYPDAALALNAEDVCELEKLGAKNLVDVLLDELDGYAKMPAALYVRFVSNGAGLRSFGYRSDIESTVYKLIKTDIDLAKFFVPTQLRINDLIVRRVPLLCNLFGSFTEYAIYKDQRNRASEILRSMDTAAKKAFQKPQSFDFAKPLAGLDPSSENAPALLEVLRLLKRRASQQKPQLLKEAA